MMNKQKHQNRQNRQNVVIVASGEFHAPNLIRDTNTEEWIGIPTQWLHLVPNRHLLKSARIVLELEYAHGETEDAERSEQSAEQSEQSEE